MKKQKAVFIASVIIIILSVILIFAILAGFLSGCTTSAEADRVNYNITRQARYFGCERRVTVYNARTDKVIMYIEGYIDVSNNSHSELVVTAKVGADQYKKNYVYLNDYTLYVVEDINGTHTDPYHYKVYFDTNVFPDIEVK